MREDVHSGDGRARLYRICAALADAAALVLLVLFLRAAWIEGAGAVEAFVYVALGVLVAAAIHPFASILRRQARGVADAAVRITPEGVGFRLPDADAFLRGDPLRAEETFVAWSRIGSVRRITVRLPVPLALGPLRLELPRWPSTAYEVEADRGRFLLLPAVVPDAAGIARTIAARAGLPLEDRTGPAGAGPPEP